MDVLTPVYGWSAEIDNNGIGTLTIDTPGRLNILSQAVFEGLAGMLDQLESHANLRALVIVSGKPSGFVAGADIDMFAHIDTAADGERMVLEAQAIFSRLAALPVPIVAAIHGACMGGGLELALCATERLASDASDTVLALPEVQLGILPGVGGTQRLPRLIGLRAALDMILTGKKVRAGTARKLGLISEVVPVELLLARARAVARQLAANPPLGKTGKDISGLLLEATIPGRALVYQKSEARVMATTHGHYPAPLLALEAVRRGYRKPLSEGLAIEARLFGELVVSPQSRNLVHLFKATTGLKNDKLPGEPVAVEKIGILGGGLMGSGIATVAADAGYQVRVKDRDWVTLGRTLSYVRRHIEERARKRRQRPAEVAMQMNRVSVSQDLSGFKGTELVIEAVFEDMRVKHQVLQDVEAVAGPRTVFASNTSALSIAAIAQGSKRPETVIGMHFFSPVEKMPLLEVIVTDQTAPWATATVVQVGRKMGKHVIVVRNQTGFYTTRIIGPYMLEAAWLLEQGVSVADIDQAMVKFGFPIGPLALMDEVGIDVGGKVIHTLQEAYGERMALPPGLLQVLKSDRQGKKNARGFYLYPVETGKKKKGSRAVDPSIKDLLPPVQAQHGVAEAEIQRRCALVFVNEAVRCLEEGVLASPRDGDIGAVFGLGFPPFRGGPFRYIDSLTAATVVQQLERLQQQYGDRFQPAARLAQMARAGESFYSG